jgi:hypothetical protein
MSIDLSQYRSNPLEQERIAGLLKLAPEKGGVALDIGTRDGFLAKILADRFEKVVALDLERPIVDHPRVECVKGDATNLDFKDRSFDLVICAEVLEHIPSQLLSSAGREIARVTAGSAIIGVPNRQDLRVDCTTCRSCGGINPPWGHVNSFSDKELAMLFPDLEVTAKEYVGTTRAATNAMSTALTRFAGNPFGTYGQEEPCIHCGAKLLPPTQRTLLQQMATRLGHIGNRTQQFFSEERGNWLHMRFERIHVRPGAGPQ